MATPGAYERPRGAEKPSWLRIASGGKPSGAWAALVDIARLLVDITTADTTTSDTTSGDTTGDTTTTTTSDTGDTDSGDQDGPDDGGGDGTPREIPHFMCISNRKLKGKSGQLIWNRLGPGDALTGQFQGDRTVVTNRRGPRSTRSVHAHATPQKRKYDTGYFGNEP